MPNHVNNKFTVVGPEEDLEAFVRQARGARRRTLAPNRNNWRYLVVWDGELPVREDESAFEFDRLLPLPEVFFFSSYTESGASLERATWGVKWGAYSIDGPYEEAGARTWEFTTAWSSPSEFVARVSERWPSLKFIVSYQGEGPVAGRYCARAGEFLDGEVADDAEAPEWSEEYDERYDEWWGRFYDDHEGFVQDCLIEYA